MLKKPASFVLASFRPSTVRRSFSEIRSTLGGFSVRQDPLHGRTAHTKCGLYLLGPSLAAALPRNGASWRAGVGWVRSLAILSILRESSTVVPHLRTIEVLACPQSFSAAC